MRALPIAPGARPAAAAALLALAVDCAYLAILRSQGDAGGSREAFVAASLAAVSALCFSAWLLAPALRALALGWSAGTLVAWTLLAAASIGLLLAPAAAFALAALARGRAPTLPAASGAAIALLTVAAGLAWTS